MDIKRILIRYFQQIKHVVHVGAANPLVRSMVAGVVGFLGYGGWAYFANMAHGMEIALRAALAQGMYCLGITFAMTLLTEYLFLRGGAVWRVITLVSVFLLAGAYLIHFYIETPEILLTILPGWSIGLVYTTVYILSMRRYLAAQRDSRES